MGKIRELEDQKESLLEALEEVNLENRHQRHQLHKLIHDLEEGLHRFEEKQLEEFTDQN